MKRNPLIRALFYGATAAATASCTSESLVPLVRIIDEADGAKRITVTVANACFGNESRLQDVLLKPLNSGWVNGRLEQDSDGDGNTDPYDSSNVLGTRPNTRFSNVERPEYGDFFTKITRTRIDQRATLPPCAEGVTYNVDPLFNDCERSALGLTGQSAVPNGSGSLPASLLALHGLALQQDEESLPAPGGMTNLQRVRAHLPVRETLTATMEASALTYDLIALEQEDERCHTMTVSNIPLFDSSLGNRLLVIYVLRDDSDRTLHRFGFITVDSSVEANAKLSFDYTEVVQ